MEIVRTNPIDYKLLAFDLFKREKMIVRVYTNQGIVLESKMIKGAKRSVSKRDQIYALISELLYIGTQKQLMIDYIEISHTHSTYKLNKDTYQIGEFSPRDVDTFNFLKRLFDHPLKLNIVTDVDLTMSKMS